MAFSVIKASWPMLLSACALIATLLGVLAWNGAVGSSIHQNILTEIKIEEEVRGELSLLDNVVDQAIRAHESYPNVSESRRRQLAQNLKELRANRQRLVAAGAKSVSARLYPIEQVLQNQLNTRESLGVKVYAQILSVDYLQVKRSLEATLGASHREVQRLLEESKALRSDLHRVATVLVCVIGLILILPLILMSRGWQEMIRKSEALEAANRAMAETKAELERHSIELEKTVEDSKTQMALLEYASNRFQQLFGGLPVGCLTYDQGGIIQEWNEAMTDLTQVQPWMVCYQHVQAVLNDPLHMDFIFDTLKSVLEEGEKASFEYRHHCQDGSTKFIYFVTYPLRSMGGDVIGGIMAGFDITERRQAEVALSQSDARFNLAMQGANSGLFDWNVEEGGQYWSPRMREILGLQDDYVPGPHSLTEQTLPDDRELLLTALDLHFVHHAPLSVEFRVERPDGAVIWVHIRGQAIWNQEGVPIRLAGSIDDITHRKEIEEVIEAQLLEINEKNLRLEMQQARLEEANQRLAMMATLDGLTGLKNHKAFQAALKEYHDYAEQTEGELSVILLDVDNFKKYNDSFGHPAGDDVLRTVAKILKEAARGSDVSARYGGEEFVILLPKCGLNSAVRVAERICQRIAEHPWALRPVTASFGVASRLPDQAERQELVERADLALYASKHAGRNQVTAWSDSLKKAA